MSKVLMTILALITINGFAQDISFYVSSKDHEYILPVDTAFRQITLTSNSLDTPHENFFYPDSISFRFPVSEDTVRYSIVGLRRGIWYVDSGTRIITQLNPFSEVDSIYNDSLIIPNDTLMGFTYVDNPGDSVSGFDLLLTYDDYVLEDTCICFWLKSDNQSDWLNFQPLGVGNIWKFNRSGEHLYDQRWEIFESLATNDTTFYSVEVQSQGSPESPETSIDTSVIFITSTDPYRILGFSGPWCEINSNFSPDISSYPSFFQTLLPRGNGDIDFGMYNPGWLGYDLATYGIGFSSATGDFGWSKNLAGYKIGSEIVGDIGTLVSVNNESQKPTKILLGNYPNPFNPSTTIEYEIPELSEVSLVVYDIAGREVHTLLSASQSPGSYKVSWNGTDKTGRMVSAGMYFARLQAGEYSSVVKMVYLR